MPVSIRPLLALDFTPAAALGIGATENVAYLGSRPYFINLVMCNATATAGVSGTAQLLRDTAGNAVFVAVTATLAMTTSGTTTINATSGAGLAASLATATYVVGATDVLRCAFVDGGGAGGANGRLVAHICPTTLAGQAPGYTGAANAAANLT